MTSDLTSGNKYVQVPVIIKVPMARFQGVAYNWIKATGTLRLDPDGPLSNNNFRAYAPLNNKVMELRKVWMPTCRARRQCYKPTRFPTVSTPSFLLCSWRLAQDPDCNNAVAHLCVR